MMKFDKNKFRKIFFKGFVGVLLCATLVCSLVLNFISLNKISYLKNNITNIQDFVFAEAHELPVFSINTENGKPIKSKDDYLNCNVSVSNADKDYCFEGKTGQIKGRGNSTWNMPKKPYKLKFDSKINLFGNGKAKTWTLIANYADYSLIRNYLAYTIADSFDDLKYTTSTQFVDLYLNGSYQGVYLVCEQVEVKENRVEIDDSIDELDTGYLLEMDYRASKEGDKNEDWFYSNKIPFAIKSPEIEDEDECVYEQEDFAAYIKNYMDTCFNKLNSNNFEDVKEYIDVNSFADAYILNELFKNKDIGFSSFYVYKEKADNHLYCGPVWDYDLSAGNSSKIEDINVKNLQAKSKNVFYKKLLEYSEFKEIVKTKLENYKDNIKVLINEKTNEVLVNYPLSFMRNFIKWDILGKKQRIGSFEVAIQKTWQDNVKFLKDWLNDSLDYMVQVYCS